MQDCELDLSSLSLSSESDVLIIVFDVFSRFSISKYEKFTSHSQSLGVEYIKGQADGLVTLVRQKLPDAQAHMLAIHAKIPESLDSLDARKRSGRCSHDLYLAIVLDSSVPVTVSRRIDLSETTLAEFAGS